MAKFFNVRNVTHGGKALPSARVASFNMPRRSGKAVAMGSIVKALGPVYITGDACPGCEDRNKAPPGPLAQGGAWWPADQPFPNYGAPAFEIVLWDVDWQDTLTVVPDGSGR